MRPVSVVVIDVRADHPAKLALIDPKNGVQAVAPQTADPSLGKSVLPRGSKGCAFLLQPKPLDPALEVGPVDLVVVANQKTTRQIE
jgi:hypothetical protein